MVTVTGSGSTAERLEVLDDNTEGMGGVVT